MNVNLYPFLSQGGFFMLNKKLIKLTSIEEALFLSDLLSKREYFRQNGDLKKTGGWFFNSQKNIELDTTLTPKQQTSLIKKLQDKKYIKVKKVGLPSVNHYFIDDSKVLEDFFDEQEAFETPVESSSEKKESLEPTKSPTNNNTIIIYQYIVELIKYLNEKTGKRFSEETKTTVSLLSARLKNYTKEDVMKVIDVKTKQWLGDEKMQKYLCPSTLFSESNFEKYLNEVPKVEEKPKQRVEAKDMFPDANL